MADPDEKIAGVIVPDYQLSLAIGKEGQNARLAARLTGYKIDIKSETQAIECGDLPENYMEQMGMVGEEGYTVGERKKSTMMFRQMQLMKTEQMRLNSLRQTKSKI